MRYLNRDYGVSTILSIQPNASAKIPHRSTIGHVVFLPPMDRPHSESTWRVKYSAIYRPIGKLANTTFARV